MCERGSLKPRHERERALTRAVVVDEAPQRLDRFPSPLVDLGDSELLSHGFT
jgi:hypothetical protein